MKLFKKETIAMTVTLIPYRPKNGDVYYWVRSDIRQVCKSEWASDAKRHEFRWSIGNVFRTRSDAEAAIKTQQKWHKELVEGK